MQYYEDKWFGYTQLTYESTYVPVSLFELTTSQQHTVLEHDQQINALADAVHNALTFNELENHGQTGECGYACLRMKHNNDSSQL